VDTGSSQGTEEEKDTARADAHATTSRRATGREAGREAMTAAEARLLTDLRRINEATVRLEQTLAEAHHALLRARAADRAGPAAPPEAVRPGAA